MYSLPFLLIWAGCSLGKMVDEDGRHSPLFPSTPLSNAPCIEDQDCVITHLKDGHCCSDARHTPSNLYTRDQFDRMVTHQAQICEESRGDYTCPETAAQGHIESVYRGMCVDNRCLRREVPAEDPAAPPPPPASTDPQSTSAPSPTPPGPIPTAASPRP
jgi:hypothetical protein